MTAILFLCGLGSRKMKAIINDISIINGNKAKFSTTRFHA